MSSSLFLYFLSTFFIFIFFISFDTFGAENVTGQKKFLRHDEQNKITAIFFSFFNQ